MPADIAEWRQPTLKDWTLLQVVWIASPTICKPAQARSGDVVNQYELQASNAFYEETQAQITMDCQGLPQMS